MLTFDTFSFEVRHFFKKIIFFKSVGLTEATVIHCKKTFELFNSEQTLESCTTARSVNFFAEIFLQNFFNLDA